MNKGLLGWARPRPYDQMRKNKRGSYEGGTLMTSPSEFMDTIRQRASIAVAHGEPATTYTGVSTWENVGTALAFATRPGREYLIEVVIGVRFTSANFGDHYIRPFIDGDETIHAVACYPANIPTHHRAANISNTPSYSAGPMPYVVRGLPGGPHTAQIQTHDNGSGVDRLIFAYTMIIREMW